ncbi:MAG: fatty acid desaturase [Geminicoccaceae bacterium]|nr:fatty acid desaturase [Geminicoccaceae bacterium]
MRARDARSAPLPVAANVAATAVAAAVAVWLFLLLPLLRGELGAGLVAASLLVSVCAIVPHWALLHEAIHGHLLPGRKLNDAVARLLAVLFLAPFDVLRFGHLEHHALNARAVERPEILDPRSEVLRRSRFLPDSRLVVYYLRLIGGLYLAEAASGLASFLPRRFLRPLVRRTFFEGAREAPTTADRAERRLLAPASLRRIRLEAAAILALLFFAFALYGEAWPLLALALCGRAFLVSLLDNAAHYGGPLGDPRQGFDLAAPRALALLVLNGNLHGTHHRHPHLPWTALPAAFAADGARYAGHYLVYPWRQFRGPIPIDRLAASVEVRP